MASLHATHPATAGHLLPLPALCGDGPAPPPKCFIRPRWPMAGPRLQMPPRKSLTDHPTPPQNGCFRVEHPNLTDGTRDDQILTRPSLPDTHLSPRHSCSPLAQDPNWRQAPAFSPWVDSPTLLPTLPYWVPFPAPLALCPGQTHWLGACFGEASVPSQWAWWSRPPGWTCSRQPPARLQAPLPRPHVMCGMGMVLLK